MTVAIAYGWSEGPWHGKKLRRALQQAGYTATKSLAKADVIIAHSGGCFMVPDNTTAQVIMLVGVPYWPSRHPLKSLLHKVSKEKKDWRWIKKTSFNTFYQLAHSWRWVQMYKAWKRLKLPLSSSASVVAIRNNHDVFSHPEALNDLANQHGWKLIGFDGTHDDIWLNPQPYVDFLLNLQV